MPFLDSSHVIRVQAAYNFLKEYVSIWKRAAKIGRLHNMRVLSLYYGYLICLNPLYNQCRI